MDTTDSGSSTSSSSGMNNNNNVSKMLVDEEDSNNAEVQQFTENATEASNNPEFKMKRISRNIFLSHRGGGVACTMESPGPSFRAHFPGRERCHSPVSSIVSSTLTQMNLKRSTSAPMINQIGVAQPAGVTAREKLTLNLNKDIGSSLVGAALSSTSSARTNCSNNCDREMSMDYDGGVASAFLASFNNPRPRRFSASFSPGSPGPAPNRVSQLRRQENTPDWEATSEKEFHGTQNMAQSWEDLSLASMSMDLPMRRPSCTDPLFVSMPMGTSSASASASSSPAASPRISNRFSPGLSSPSPTRKSFTSRRSLSPIATMRPSVLSIGLSSQGLKRKSSCWDSGDTMDCQPAAKRSMGLLTPGSPLLINHSNNGSPSYTVFPTTHQLHQNQLLRHSDSPNSLDTTGTESSVSSVSGGGGDSPFFRPLDSPSDISSSGSPLTKL